MSETEFKILDLLKENPQKELPTTYIISHVDPKLSKINEILSNERASHKEIKDAKRKKAQLHRKILYYLNKLVSNDVIKVSKEGKKGEKFFILNIDPDEELVLNKYYKRKIRVSPTLIISTPIEGYEKVGIIDKFEVATWIDRLNCILIDINAMEYKDVINNILTCFSSLNDVLLINNFEEFVENNSASELISLINRLSNECRDYNKRVSITIDTTHINENNYSKLLKIFMNYKEIKSENIIFIFDTNPRELQDNSDFFEKVIEIFSKNGKLYIKNDNLVKTPYAMGLAGPYCFSQDEWSYYKKKYPKKVSTICCAQSTIGINFSKLILNNKISEEANNILLNAAKSILTGNSLQRRRASEYFKNLVKMNKEYSRMFFNLSRNYLRFYNYGWKQPGVDQNKIIDFLNNIKKDINRFCVNEEIIYLSCGMPMRFKISFSTAFKDYYSKIFEQPHFARVEIKRTEDLHSSTIKEVLRRKEKLVKIFDGGDRTGFHRSGNADIDDIISELNILLSTYKLPFFTYDFRNMHSTTTKLNQFIKWD